MHHSTKALLLLCLFLLMLAAVQAQDDAGARQPSLPNAAKLSEAFEKKVAEVKMKRNMKLLWDFCSNQQLPKT